MNIRRKAVALVVAVLAASASSGTAVADRGDDPLVRTSTATYKALSAQWWQWAVSTPSSDQGPFGQNGTDCGQNQPMHDTWFLAGQFTEIAAVRTCTIPLGTRLFVPIVNVECSSVEADPFFGATPAARRTCLQSFGFSALEATLDRHAVVRDFDRYTVMSRDFPFVGVDGNPALIPTGPGSSTSNGVWLLLAPLSRGRHVLSFTGTISYAGSASIPAFTFTTKATYKLLVK